MTNPTNTDLAAALREIADTLPLGSQLIVRLAADRLPLEGWIEWDHTAPGANKGPDLEPGERVEVRTNSGFPPRNNGVGPVASWLWDRTITHYRLIRN